MDWKAKLAKSRARKAKRTAKRRLLFSGKPRALTTSELKQKLWSVVSFFIRTRDKVLFGLCRIGEACGGQGPIEVAYHVMPSNDGAMLRYDPRNLVGACRRCNEGERHHRIRYLGVHERVLGKEFVERLRELSGQVKKYSKADYVALRERFALALERGEWDFGMRGELHAGPAPSGGRDTDSQADVQEERGPA